MQVMAVRLTIDDIFFLKKTFGKKITFLARILPTKTTSTSITIPSFHKRMFTCLEHNVLIYAIINNHLLKSSVVLLWYMYLQSGFHQRKI